MDTEAAARRPARAEVSGTERGNEPCNGDLGIASGTVGCVQFLPRSRAGSGNIGFPPSAYFRWICFCQITVSIDGALQHTGHGPRRRWRGYYA